MKGILSVILVASIVACTSIVDPIPADCTGSTLELVVNSVTSASGCGISDGEIAVMGSGGEGDYEYRMGNGDYQNSGTFSGLLPGFYQIEISDNIGCSRLIEVSLPSENGVSIDEIVVTNSDCDLPTGTVTVFTSGGTNVFYKLENGTYDSNNTLSGLATGEYIVFITDDSGCEVSTQITIKAEIPFSIIRDILNTNCTISGCHDGSTSRTDFTIDANVVASANFIKTRTGNKSMPRASSGLSLTNSEIQQIACWVENGAEIN